MKKTQVVKVGFFDSGHGGLDLLKETMREFGVGVEFYYAADLAYLPYGELSQEDIKKRAFFLTDLLKEKGCDIIVVACNTATAVAIESLRETYEGTFVGVEPYLNYINKIPTSHIERGQVGALVTPNTFKSQRFLELKKNRDPQGLIQVLALGELAPLIEKFLLHKNAKTFKADLGDLLEPFLPLNWKETILGCTHYPLVASFLEEVLNTQCVSPTPAVVQHLQRLSGLKTDKCAHLSENPLHYWSSLEKVWCTKTLGELLPAECLT